MLELSLSTRTKTALFFVLSAVSTVAVTTAAVAHTATPVHDDVSSYLEHPLVEGTGQFPAGQAFAPRELGFDIEASARVGDRLAGDYAVALASTHEPNSEGRKEHVICLTGTLPANSAGGGSEYTACHDWSLAEEQGLYTLSTDPDGYHLSAFVPGAQHAALETSAEAQDNGGGVGRVDRDGSMVEATGTWDEGAVEGSAELVISRPDAEPVRIELTHPETDVEVDR